MKHFSLFQVILVSIIILLNCMIFTLLCSLFTFKTRYIIKESACIIEEQDALITHNVNLTKMYLPFTKFTNKFHNFQAISQHSNNKQDVNILKHTYTYFTTTYIPLNIFLITTRTIIFTRFMVRGLNTDNFPFLILRDVIGY